MRDEEFAIQNEDFPPLNGERHIMKHDNNVVMGSMMNGGGIHIYTYLFK
jgi:hypothetical protein